MQLVNATAMNVGWTQGLDPDGTERAVVVVKGTFDLPPEGGAVRLAREQVDFVYADTFTGEPGQSAPVYEADFAPVKLRCDVLLHGHAYAPSGVPAETVDVAVAIGAWAKSFQVVGERHWTAGVGGLRPSEPVAFTKMPVTYDRAFGGFDVADEDPANREAYAQNPVGRGFSSRAKDMDVLGKPVPNTQDIDDPITKPHGTYRPCSFGPVGRNFADRLRLAGTYDERWLEDGFPFLPQDFDSRYYQSAPPDQQLGELGDGDAIRLANLTPTPRGPWQMPADLSLSVEFTDVEFHRTRRVIRPDTVILEPDELRLQLIWRDSLPLRRNIREVAQIVVGTMPRGWYRARDLGKRYYSSIHALAVSRKAMLDGD